MRNFKLNSSESTEVRGEIRFQEHYIRTKDSIWSGSFTTGDIIKANLRSIDQRSPYRF